MGYILPITPYQLMQYAERELVVKHNPYQFVPTPKIMNELKYERYVAKNLDEEKQQRRQREQAETKKTVPASSQQRQCNEVIYAELTGKGITISERI